jgi:hypothetical protein
VQWLRCYALSIENAGGNNDTKCLYFPFYLDQAPLTWLESLEKYSIDKWDQLKEQFTSNFAGVGDRPRGPLKQWGNPHLNSCIKVS